jgi:hypothetical protein
MISFLSRTIDLFFFFLSLWIYLWLAETSQQPISQTTWLKVTPHCNHCIRFALPLFTLVVPPTFYFLFQPASLAPFFIYQLSVRFNLVVGSLLSPLDLCNTPTKKPFQVTV